MPGHNDTKQGASETTTSHMNGLFKLCASHIINGNLHGLTFLLSLDGTQHIDLNELDNHILNHKPWNRTALGLAIYFNKTDIVTQLVAAGADVTRSVTLTEPAIYPVMSAAIWERWEQVTILAKARPLQAGDDENIKEQYGKALLQAVLHKKHDALRVLLESCKGADLTAYLSDGLVKASDNGDFVGLQLLLDYGADAFHNLRRKSPNGRYLSPIENCIYGNRDTALGMMIRHRKLSAQEKDSELGNAYDTALVEAARRENYDIVIDLLNAGANPNRGNALFWAIRYKNKKMIQALIAFGADIYTVHPHPEHKTKCNAVDLLNDQDSNGKRSLEIIKFYNERLNNTETYQQFRRTVDHKFQHGDAINETLRAQKSVPPQLQDNEKSTLKSSVEQFKATLEEMKKLNRDYIENLLKYMQCFHPSDVRTSPEGHVLENREAVNRLMGICRSQLDDAHMQLSREDADFIRENFAGDLRIQHLINQSLISEYLTPHFIYLLNFLTIKINAKTFMINYDSDSFYQPGTPSHVDTIKKHLHAFDKLKTLPIDPLSKLDAIIKIVEQIAVTLDKTLKHNKHRHYETTTFYNDSRHNFSALLRDYYNELVNIYLNDETNTATPIHHDDRETPEQQSVFGSIFSMFGRSKTKIQGNNSQADNQNKETDTKKSGLYPSVTPSG